MPAFSSTHLTLPEARLSTFPAAPPVAFAPATLTPAKYSAAFSTWAVPTDTGVPAGRGRERVSTHPNCQQPWKKKPSARPSDAKNRITAQCEAISADLFAHIALG